MITKENVVSVWRFYPPEVTRLQAESHAVDFSGVCVIVHLTEKKIFVKGMLADMNLSMKREFIRACVEEGIETIQMERATNRSMPFARRIDDHHEIQVKDLVARLNRPRPVEGRRVTDGD